MVVGAMDLPEITIDSYLVKTAKEKGLFYSFINARAYALGKIDDTLFKEMLSDWQYYGPQNKKPQWLP